MIFFPMTVVTIPKIHRDGILDIKKPPQMGRF
ncbi:hypothetical protein AND4_13496 [Vibrio sp. AND4]|nr:hypothetical protein AND4_13496 [Vibrio sp. AND4]